MKIKPVALVALVAAALTVLPTATAYASCKMAAGKTDSVTRVLEQELDRAAPWHPGSDARDAEWLKDNIPAMVPDWLPETKRVVTEAKTDIHRVVDDCYQPGDYSVAGSVRFDFIDCAKEGALSQVTAFSPAEWTTVCDEVRTALDAPAIEDQVRTWARTWVDAYIEYAQNRPAR